jgi:hypothetical protein
MKYFPPLLYRHEHRFREEFDPGYQSRYDKFVDSFIERMHSECVVNIYMGALAFLFLCLSLVFFLSRPVDPGMWAVMLLSLFLVPLAYITHCVLTAHYLYRRYFPLK